MKKTAKVLGLFSVSSTMEGRGYSSQKLEPAKSNRKKELDYREFSPKVGGKEQKGAVHKCSGKYNFSIWKFEN